MYTRIFVYTFSTGAYIDSLELSGKMMLAESGKTDSTLLALLYRDAPDSAVTNRKPDYISRIKGDGSFLFTHLPSGNFKLYALKDGDGNKYYNSKTELFAFHTEDINLPQNGKPVTIYAYAEEKPAENKSTTPEKKQAEKKLRYSTNLTGMRAAGSFKSLKSASIHPSGNLIQQLFISPIQVSIK